MEDGRSHNNMPLTAAFNPILIQECTEMRFASFLSNGFIVVNPPERKLAKRISVEWVIYQSFFFVPYTLLLLRDGKPLFREGVISKIAISLRCCQLGMKHLGVE